MSSYEASVDRLDVAVRAILLLVRRGKWPLISSLTDLTRREHHEHIYWAVLQASHLKGDARLFNILEACPFLVEAAVEMQGAYQRETGLSRLLFYQAERKTA